jgi:hypothetical protein
VKVDRLRRRRNPQDGGIGLEQQRRAVGQVQDRRASGYEHRHPARCSQQRYMGGWATGRGDDARQASRIDGEEV